MLWLRKVACLLILFGAFSAFARELPGEQQGSEQLKRELPGDSGAEG
jgi:hypothetical protein